MISEAKVQAAIVERLELARNARAWAEIAAHKTAAAAMIDLLPEGERKSSLIARLNAVKS